MTIWAIPCTTCGAWFALFEADDLPRKTDYIRWPNFRDLHGRDFNHSRRAVCFSCGANIDRMVTDPLDWVRVDPDHLT